MKWFIVVLFLLDPNADATADRDIYVFTDPTFESQQQCQSDVVDPAVYPTLVEKLLLEYKYPNNSFSTRVGYTAGSTTSD